MSKFDVFLSFSGLDTGRSFITFLYKELDRRNIPTFKDDKEPRTGREISPELIHVIEESRFAVVVVSKNYSASSRCLDELVKIMEFVKKGSLTVMPIFYGVEPTHLRRQIKEVAEQFETHESKEDQQKVLSWRQALFSLASISGHCSRKWNDDAKMIDVTADQISKKLMRIRARPRGPRRASSIVGINQHMKAIDKLLELNSNGSVRLVGIWARGGTCRSALAAFVYQKISQHFKSHCYLGSVKKITKGRHMSRLREELTNKFQSESRVKNQKVLLVADDVNKLDQLDALADDFNGFGPGSVVIVTTQDKQLFASYGITDVYEAELLRFREVRRQLIRQVAFNEVSIAAVFESVVVSQRVLPCNG
ncbi:unnamed protein product [Microthlaspi erraticum]|uniref:TIR domain-containing protein n=1 Tax=Microthlaspi erraticum TaxID=1685480 RepID=A0A6D2JTB7_9BRAS|nr:unnamed protein product [Microthlaspi erraticum]